MSLKIIEDTLNLKFAERVAHTEYMDSDEMVRYYSQKNDWVERAREFEDIVGIDFHWNVNDGFEPWQTRGRTTNMGHAEYMENGKDFVQAEPSPFKSYNDVLEFDAVKEYGLTDFSKLVEYYQKNTDQDKINFPEQYITGGYYNSVVSGAIAVFGWEMLLEAIGNDADKFGEEVLGSIAEQSVHHAKAWAETDKEWFITHDDMVWTEGPFISPDFYRTYIFPRYTEIWKPLKEKGKKIIFCSDGTFDMFFDDIAKAGADGFSFEPTNNLEKVVTNYGSSHILIAGSDCRTLTWGTKEDIKNELEWIYGLARKCPGFIFCASNHFPANIPIDNGVFYFNKIKELEKR